MRASIPSKLAGSSLQTDASLKKSGRGSYDYIAETNENIMLLKWFDNKAVHLISSYKNQEPIEIVRRWSVAAKQHVNVPRPEIVKEYNTFMGGVDLHDMLVQLYRTNIKGRRFYFRIIFHLINMACVSAWLLYRRHCEQKSEKYRPLLHFVCDIAAGLLKRFTTEPRKRGRPTNSAKPGPSKKRTETAPRPVADVRYDGVGHWPQPLPEKSRCRLCVKCYSRMKCEKYNVILCQNKNNNCFKDFYTK
jgi:DNA excision repair protein ERCC-6